MESWNYLTQAFQFQYFLHWFSPSKTSEASPIFPRLLTLLVSTQLLLPPDQSGGRGDWLSMLYIQRKPMILVQGGESPLSEILFLSLQDAGCILHPGRPAPPQNLPPSCWIHFYQGVSHFFNLWASTRFRVKGKANPHRAFRLPGNSDEGFITRQRWLPFSFQLWLVAQKPQPSYREALLNHHYFSY